MPSEGARGPAASSHSPYSRSGARSYIEPSQPNNFASAPMKTPEPSSSTGRPQRHLCSATTNRGKSPYPMDPMAKSQHPPQRRCSPRRALQLSRPHMPTRTTTALGTHYCRSCRPNRSPKAIYRIPFGAKKKSPIYTLAVRADDFSHQDLLRCRNPLLRHDPLTILPPPVAIAAQVGIINESGYSPVHF